MIELKKKIDELKEMLKQQEAAREEISKNILKAKENKKHIETTITTIKGVCDGIQFSLNQLAEDNKANSAKVEPEKKKAK